MQLIDILKLRHSDKQLSFVSLSKNSLSDSYQVQLEKLAKELFVALARNYRNATLPMNLLNAILLFYQHGGCMKLEEVVRKKSLLREIQSLQRRGIVMAIPSIDRAKEFYLPTEYLFYLEHIIKNQIDEKTLYRGLLLYKSDEIKKLPSFIHETYHTSFKYANSKAENQAIVYDFVTAHIQKMKENLTCEQKTIIQFIAERRNRVSSKELMKKFPLLEKSHSNVYLSDIIRRFRYTDKNEPTELQKLFLSGLLIPLGDDWNSFQAAAIPQEIYPAIAQEHIIELQRKQEKLIKEIESEEIPVRPLSKEKKITLDVKRLLLAVELLSFQYTSSAQKKGLGKRDLNRVAEILKEDLLYLDCLLTYLLGNCWIEAEKEVLQITNQGEQFLSLSDESPKSYKILWGFFTESPKWNELLKTNKMLGYDNQDISDFILKYRKLLAKLLSQFPRKWIKPVILKQLLLLQQEYDWIKTQYTHLIRTEETGRWNKSSWRRYYYDVEKNFISKFVSEEEIFFNVLLNLYHLGFIEISSKNGNIQSLKLTAVGRHFICHEKMNFCPGLEIKPREKRITIQPNMEIICSLHTSLNSLRYLSHFSNLKQIDRVVLFEISREALIFGSAKYSLKFEDIETFLSQHSTKAIPQNILYLLKECASKQGELELATCGGYLIAKDSHLLETIRHQKIFQQYIQEYITANAIILKDGVTIDKLFSLLRKKGYMPKGKDVQSQESSHRPE